MNVNTCGCLQIRSNIHREKKICSTDVNPRRILKYRSYQTKSSRTSYRKKRSYGKRTWLRFLLLCDLLIFWFVQYFHVSLDTVSLSARYYSLNLELIPLEPVIRTPFRLFSSNLVLFIVGIFGCRSRTIVKKRTKKWNLHISK